MGHSASSVLTPCCVSCSQRRKLRIHSSCKRFTVFWFPANSRVWTKLQISFSRLPEDIKQVAATEEQEGPVGKKAKEAKFAPVCFSRCVHFKNSGRPSRNTDKTSRGPRLRSPDKSVIVNCAISKEYDPKLTHHRLKPVGSKNPMG